MVEKVRGVEPALWFAGALASGASEQAKPSLPIPTAQISV